MNLVTMDLYLKPPVLLEVRLPRCVGSITRNFVYYTYSRTQLYLPSSTVGIQLHVSALYVGHLQVEIQLTDQLYKMYGVFFWGLRETISRSPNLQKPEDGPHIGPKHVVVFLLYY